MKPVSFPSPPAWHAWLEKNHQTHQELLVGFHKKGSGKPSITWPESVDEALCVGWIDGIRRRIDDDRYSIPFAPCRAAVVSASRSVLGDDREAGRDAAAADGVADRELGKGRDAEGTSGSEGVS